MSVEEIVKDCMANVPKALAAGVVDMDSGMLLAIKRRRRQGLRP